MRFVVSVNGKPYELARRTITLRGGKQQEITFLRLPSSSFPREYEVIETPHSSITDGMLISIAEVLSKKGIDGGKPMSPLEAAKTAAELGASTRGLSPAETRELAARLQRALT